MAATLYNPDGYEILIINAAPPPDPSAEIARLEAQVAALEAELATAQAEIATLTSDLLACEAQLGGQPNPPKLVPLLTTEAGKYRNSQPYLFQTVHAASEPARVAGGAPFANEGSGSIVTVGPTAKFVDKFASWPWDRVGGDFLDKTLARNPTSPVPWFAIKADAVGNTTVKTYSQDCTEYLQFIQTSNRWNALLLEAGASTFRNIATTFGATPPRMDVAYVDGSSEALACRLVAYNNPSSDYSRTTSVDVQCPCFLEFERPRSAVLGAHITLTVTQHWSGPNPNISAYVLDPPLNTDQVELGVASTTELDDGLEKDAAIIGVHRYLDGSAFDDFAMGPPPQGLFPTANGGYGTGSEDWFDPAIYGNGPTRLDRLPHYGVGKWINTNVPVPPDTVGQRSKWELVRSDYQSNDGFAPLAPGLGAMRVFMAGNPDLHDGITEYAALGYSTTTAVIYLPESLWGIDDLYVRYYVRMGAPLGQPYRPPRDKRYHVFIGSSPIWTEMTGKFGIVPSHDNTYGGFSGSAGGPYGWQWRETWADCTHDDTGPDLGGMMLGTHTFDFLTHCPPGYDIGRTDTPKESGFGQRGGLGGVLYACHWYCHEQQLKLNTIMDTAPGFLADGESRKWIDGRLVNQRTGLVFRSGPIYNPGYKANAQRPIRNLGHRNLLLNIFHGGKTMNTIDRSFYFTGLAYGTQRIGPMMVAP